MPCGLSWSAIALASQDAPPAAALGAFAFGLATAPGLALALAGAQLASARLRRVAPVVLGVALVAFGVWTMVRGTAAANGEPCCEETERASAASFGDPADRTAAG